MQKSLLLAFYVEVRLQALRGDDVVQDGVAGRAESEDDERVGECRVLSAERQDPQRHVRPIRLLERRANLLQANEAVGLRPWELMLARSARYLPAFSRPPQGSDVLYSSDNSHEQVSHPDPGLTGHRPGRPKVHYGRIGGGF